MVITEVTPVGQTVRWQDSAGTARSAKSRRTPFRRQFTPYNKTPGSRRLGLSVQRRITRSPSRQAVSQKELVGKTWRVFKSTPLYRFSYNAPDLRRYSKQLSAYIEAEMKKGLAVGSDEIPNIACITAYKGLNVKSEDKEAVQIILKKRSKKDGSLEPVVTALLVCTDMDEDIAETVHDAFIPLPLLMAKGPITLTNLLTGWLESQFDCSISNLALPPISLHWMVAMWAGHVPEMRARPVELCYAVPDEVEGLNTITMTIHAKDCKLLWDGIHPRGDRFMEEEAQQFIKALEAHFHHIFKINLSAMRLKRIGTAIAYVGTEGKIKIFSEEYLPNILAHLTELASEHVLTL